MPKEQRVELNGLEAAGVAATMQMRRDVVGKLNQLAGQLQAIDQKFRENIAGRVPSAIPLEALRLEGEALIYETADDGAENVS